jgi:hypothetical protein
LTDRCRSPPDKWQIPGYSGVSDVFLTVFHESHQLELPGISSGWQLAPGSL